MRRRLIPILALTALGLTAGASAAAARGNLIVGLNEGVALQLRGQAGTVAIDNPAVADVSVPNGHSVVVLGRGYGATHLTVIDRAGHRLVDTVVTVVSRDDGRVTVYRGLSGSDYTCVGGRCHPLDGPPSGGGSAGGDVSSAASPGASTGSSSTARAPGSDIGGDNGPATARAGASAAQPDPNHPPV